MYPTHVKYVTIPSAILNVPRVKRIKHMGENTEFFFDYEDIVKTTIEKENLGENTLCLTHTITKENKEKAINNFKNPAEHRPREWFENSTGWGSPKSKNYFIPERKNAVYAWPYNKKDLPFDTEYTNTIYIHVKKQNVNISCYNYLDLVLNPPNHDKFDQNKCVTPETYSEELVFDYNEFVKSIKKYNKPIKEKHLNFNIN